MFYLPQFCSGYQDRAVSTIHWIENSNKNQRISHNMSNSMLMKPNTHILQFVTEALFRYNKSVLTEPVKVLQDVSDTLPPVLWGLFGSEDIFTYLPERESFSFISLHALQWISVIWLYSVWSTVTWRRVVGLLRSAYLIDAIFCQLRLYASCLVWIVGGRALRRDSAIP